MDFISLYELNVRIKQAVAERFSESVWIAAEITSVQENRSGHCYLELADKSEKDEKVTAVARGTIWAFTYRMLKPYFETTTGRCLEKGMKVLVKADVVFHEVYGFSLNIRDIDPDFTLGDLERKKREILKQLEKDGIIDMNRNLEMPLLPKNIAVISSPTAAGLGDFMNHLLHNACGYRFHIKLFPAVMQGEKTTESVIAALEKIYEYESLFDAVVIIRGGGSQTDLGCFDTYDLAANVAQFPLPVIAGIGHERDETIVDRVAYMRVKTPTAAAAFLIECFQETETVLEELRNDFVTGVEALLQREKHRQMLQMTDLKRLSQGILSGQENRLKLLAKQLEHGCRMFVYNRLSGFVAFRSRLENRSALLFDRGKNRLDEQWRLVKQKCTERLVEERHTLELAENTVRYADPKKVLERGYSITHLNGKAVKSIKDVKEGDVLETWVADGKIGSVVCPAEN